MTSTLVTVGWRGLELDVSRFRPPDGPLLQILTGPAGPGPADRAALMVHSLTSHAHSWLPVISRMRAGRFVCADLRGHGGSEWSRDGYWLADYAGDLRELCAALPYEEIDIVAPSVGGRIAVLLAAALGERVRRLVLLDSAPSISPAATTQVNHIGTSNRRKTAFVDEDDVVRFWAAEHPSWEAEAIAVRAQFLYRRNWAGLLVSANDPEANYLFGSPALVEVDDVWAALARITALTTVVRGRGSYLTDEATTRRMLNALPRGRYLEVDAGHYLVYEDATALARLLDDLLA